MSIKEQIKQHAGSENKNYPKMIEATEVRLNGDEGVFEKTTKKGEEYVKEKLAVKTLRLIFLRKRRRLTEYGENGLVDISTEHGKPTDTIYLFKSKQRGVAKDIREKNPGLRTQEMYYSLLGGELVKVLIKGASLGSTKKSPDSVPLYDYLKSFHSDEEPWMYETEIAPMKEGKGTRTYYAMNFVRGKELTEKQLEPVLSEMQRLNENFREMDGYANNEPTDKVDTEITLEDEKGVDLPENWPN